MTEASAAGSLVMNAASVGAMIAITRAAPIDANVAIVMANTVTESTLGAQDRPGPCPALAKGDHAPFHVPAIRGKLPW